MAVLNGTGAGETIDGTAGDDLIRGYGGDDTLNGLGGDDDLRGGAGRDFLYGGDGNDILDGGDGNDYLYPGSGNNTVDGGAGSYDILGYNFGDFGAGALDVTITDSSISDANSGRTDTLANIESLTFFAYTSLDDMIDASAVTAMRLNLASGAGNDMIIGSAGNDLLQPGAGSDTVNGGAGFDSLSLNFYHVGLAGADITITDSLVSETTSGDSNMLTSIESVDVEGSSGDDVFDASAATVAISFYASGGVDTYTGGAGANVFSYLTLGHVTDGDDTITDFGTGDVLEFSSIQYNSGVTPVFIGMAAFSGVAGEYRYEHSGGQTHVQFDADGDTVFDGQIILSNGEFDLAETGAGSNQLIIAIVDDISADTSTTGTLAVGGSVSSQLDFLGDQDWFAITLTAGEIYIFDLFGSGGSPLADPYMYLYDSAGSLITYNDDTDGLNSQISYTATYSGTYYVAADAFADGYTGDYTLTAASPAIPVDGTSGDDTLDGTAGPDILNGLEGNDTLNGFAGSDQLNGGDGNDVLSGGAGDNTLNGDDGDDTFYLDAGSNSYIGGGAGFDTISINANWSTFYNLDGSYAGYRYFYDAVGGYHEFVGIERIDFLGSYTETFLFGTSGNDTLDGSAIGNRVSIYGDDGDDTLIGSDFGDTLDGGLGNDTLLGELGNDFLGAQAGDADMLDGGDGYDQAQVSNSGPAAGDITITDLAISFSGYANALSLTSIEYISIYDYSGGNTIDGSAATIALWLRASSGSHTLIGGSAADYIHGGFGSDTMTGNGGLDTFGYDSGLVGIMDGDIITDAESGEIVDFRGADFNDGDLTFIDQAAFSGVAGEIRWEASGGQTLIQADMDGDGTADETLTIQNGEFGVRLDQMDYYGESFSLILVENLDLAGNGGDNTLIGGAGNDLIRGFAGDDYIDGQAGNDDLRGGAGNDTILGGTGDNIIDGGADDDNIHISLGSNNLIDGGSGHDIVHISGAGSYFANLVFDEDNPAASVEFVSSYLWTGAAYELFYTTITNVEQVNHDQGGVIREHHFGTDASEVFDMSGVTNAVSVFSGAGDDTLIGNDNLSQSGILVAGNGNDTVQGGDAGELIIVGTQGDNTVDGGGGGNSLGVRDDAGGSTASYSATVTDTTVDLGATGGLTSFTNIGSLDLWFDTSGNNTVDASANSIGVSVLTGSGEDMLTGGTGSDYLDGAGGNDTLNGGDGDDIIVGGQGSDTLTGGAGLDVFELSGNIIGVMDGDTVTDMEAGEQFEFYNSSDLFLSYVGTGAFTGVAGQIRTEQADGNTLLILDSDGDGTGDETLTILGEFGLSASYDSYTGELQFLTAVENLDITGTANDDSLAGDEGDDLIRGFAGNDILEGFGGNDDLRGGAGNDVLYGDDGDDILNAGGGDDYAYGGNGDDILDAGDGDDSAYGGNGHDTLLGGEGNDLLVGDGGDDLIQGGPGIDALYGNDGNDQLDGGDGVDFLRGRAGADLLTGGAGRDYFTNFVLGEADGDVITDYEADELIGWEYSGLFTPDFIGTAAFSGGVGQLRYEKSGGQTIIEFDSDGDGSADETMIIANGEFDLILASYEPEFNFIALGTAVSVTETGTDETDELLGTGLGDTLSGAAGNDYLYGFGGDDVLSGGSGNDYVYGYDGADTLLGGDGDDVIYGDSGDDSLNGGNDNDFLSGNSGNDTLEGGSGNDTLYGGTGMDELFGGAGADYLFGDDGDDTLRGQGGSDSLYGDSGNDDLAGNNGEDGLSGGAGNDLLDGGQDNDQLYGGADNDTAFGGSGQDWIEGEDGDDLLLGQGGEDYIDGGSGNDELRGGGKDDALYGNDGDDLIFGETGADELYGGEGNDTLSGAGGADTLFGDGGDDDLNGGVAIDTLNGGDGNDLLSGGGGNDVLNGEAGEDRLFGDEGNDMLDGGAGFDRLNGGEGIDVLTGGADVDWFILTGADFGNDRVTDFEDGVDKLVFRASTGVTSMEDINDIRQAGSDVVIETDAGNIRLENFDVGDVDAGDFVFG